MKTIALFSVNLEDGVETFEILSDGFSIETDGEEAWVESKETEIFVVNSDGSKESFEVVATTWRGYCLTPFDALCITINAYFNADPDYTFFEVDESIVSLFKQVKTEPVCFVNNMPIPAHYYSFDSCGCVYNLVFVTDQNVYYAYYEDVIMCSADNLKVLTRNHPFAENALTQSVENTMTGTEVEIWADESIEYIREDIRQYS